MHAAAAEWLEAFGSTESLHVLEIGSRNINGSARVHWPNARWLGIDRSPGPGVDVVCDILDYQYDYLHDLVICCEVLEHCEQWRAICARARHLLLSTGRFIGTAAGITRAPHSAVDGGPLRPGEYYANICWQDLHEALRDAGFQSILIHEIGTDVRWVAE